MQKNRELTADELDSACGGSRSSGGTGGSAVSDFINWLLGQLHIPTSPGGPIRS
jgi:hypothetical protein